ncbi:hypothetical protein Hanom_Chr17g01579711 [Helianthus anomalus]
MSTGEQPETLAEEMSSSLLPLKRSEETFNGLVTGFKFSASWGDICPHDGQTAV